MQIPYGQAAALPITKVPPWFRGQMGVRFGGSPKGILTHPDAIVLYVDSGHPDANDNADGTDPRQPLATVQTAVDSSLLTDYSTIQVSGDVAEDVVGPDYVTGPSYVQIIGRGVSRYSPAWVGDAADEISLDLRAVGWRVSGFRFYGKVSASCIALRHTDTGANDIAIRTVIDNCYFDGLETGLRGIESHGCYDVWVLNNTFQLWNNAGNTAIGMEVLTTPLAIPYRNYVIGNVFMDSDNGMAWESNGSYFAENVVQPVGYAYSMVIGFHTSVVANPGDDNMVIDNVFPGDYALAGGLYRGGAADVWLANKCDDVADGNVADNGFSVSRPS